ncbi:MAG: CPBP family intramembrane metalloprotease [Oscillospiraceae bacterium]|nr:CPBP family intramembrane metalloprotease [Oscillospiraceae bacterium]
MNSFSNRDLIAPTKKELWGGLLCWICYQLIFPLALSMIPFFHEDSIRAGVLFDITLTVCSFLLILTVFRNYLYRCRIPFGLLLTFGFLGYIASMGLESLWGLLLSFLTPLLPSDATNMNQDIINSYMQSYSTLMILNVSLLTPFVEEILFRTVIFAPLCKRSPFLGYSVSMITFAALHVVGFIGQQAGISLLFSFLQYLPAGFVLCWSYQASRSIWPPIVIHGITNLVASFYILA